MHKIQIIQSNQILDFPETPHEFTRAQLLAFTQNIIEYQSGNINFQKLKTNCVYAFLNMKRTANLSNKDHKTVIESINQLSKLIEPYFTTKREKGKELKVINMQFHTQHLPSITVGNTVFHGPIDALFNTVYGEYLQAITHLTDFTQNPQPETLNLLIATLYRPEKPNYNTIKTHPDFDGDIRIKFNPNLTETYAQTLAQLPYHVKYAIFLYLASSQHFIATNSALEIGGGNTIDLTMLFSKTSNNTKTANGLGMIGTLYSLAETKVFGNVKDVAETNTYDILAFLVNQKTEFEKLNKKQHATTT